MCRHVPGVARLLATTSMMLTALSWAAGGESLYDGCSDEEAQGIAQCESPGESFFFDQAKAKRCPGRGSNESTWTCENWKCHMLCSDPANGKERKSCDRCEEPPVSDACHTSRQTLCEAFASESPDCDVNCLPTGQVDKAAVPRHSIALAALAATAVALAA
mmetsp:Transcript_113117/g.316109  ORF Transcript_113117/g.316109 Transcript_113117/m.316109 type:complete len:161 (+) Transcript_113117:71-553(+)